MSTLEIERKWLIARPDETALAALDGAVVSSITQVYLNAPSGTTRRIRARTTDGVTAYTQTTKRRIDALTSEEDEHILTEGQYLALLDDADPACTPIEKHRWKIPHGDLTLEVDIYPFWNRQAVLEIELPSPDTPTDIPPFITVLREVTGDRAYSNHTLSRRIPAEEN